MSITERPALDHWINAAESLIRSQGLTPEPKSSCSCGVGDRAGPDPVPPDFIDQYLLRRAKAIAREERLVREVLEIPVTDDEVAEIQTAIRELVDRLLPRTGEPVRSPTRATPSTETTYPNGREDSCPAS